MTGYSSFCDDYYVNLNFNTELELPSQRETVLQYFEQIQRRYPAMKNFFGRETGEYVLEEEKDRNHYRWATLENKRICAGQVNPDKLEDALDLHRYIAEVIPYYLSVSPLECESINLMMGFDFNFRGNQNQLLAEALGITPAFERLLEIPGAAAVAYEPSFQVALDPDCRIQFRISIEPRTNAYHVRTGEYPEEQMSVYATARRFGSLESGESILDATNQLISVCTEMIDDYVVENILRPLQQAIALR